MREGSIGRISTERTFVRGTTTTKRQFFMRCAAMKSLAHSLARPPKRDITGLELERKVFIWQNLAENFSRRPSLPFNYAILHASVSRREALCVGVPCKYTAFRDTWPTILCRLCRDSVPLDSKESIRSRFRNERAPLSGARRIITFYECTLHSGVFNRLGASGIRVAVLYSFE